MNDDQMDSEDEIQTPVSAEFVETFETLISLIGEESAWKVCEFLQGEQITFPKSILRFRRNREIREKFKNGSSYLELGREYGLTSRQIRHIVHVGDKTDQAYRQLQLI